MTEIKRGTVRVEGGNKIAYTNDDGSEVLHYLCTAPFAIENLNRPFRPPSIRFAASNASSIKTAVNQITSRTRN